MIQVCWTRLQSVVRRSLTTWALRRTRRRETTMTRSRYCPQFVGKPPQNNNKRFEDILAAITASAVPWPTAQASTTTYNLLYKDPQEKPDQGVTHRRMRSGEERKPRQPLTRGSGTHACKGHTTFPTGRPTTRRQTVETRGLAAVDQRRQSPSHHKPDAKEKGRPPMKDQQ